MPVMVKTSCLLLLPTVSVIVIVEAETDMLWDEMFPPPEELTEPTPALKLHPLEQ
jgi:hypothetical protein